ncbi:hypothetical protein KJ765_03020 [Candidatus Micrarchaeota archaeon]|nr:hypothetical protein [Candidatus Micrarchaeota archaeon]
MQEHWLVIGSVLLLAVIAFGVEAHGGLGEADTPRSGGDFMERMHGSFWNTEASHMDMHASPESLDTMNAHHEAMHGDDFSFEDCGKWHGEEGFEGMREMHETMHGQ